MKKVGVLTLDRCYPLLCGNVANPCSYDFEVLVRKIPGLFYPPSPPLYINNKLSEHCKKVLQAALLLEKEGVEVIVMSCGFFSLLQPIFKEKISIPVYSSSLLLIPMILNTLPKDGFLGIATLYKEYLTDEYFEAVGVKKESLSRIILTDMSSAEEFRRIIKYDSNVADISKWKSETLEAIKNLLNERPEIKVLLLECSDMPPFSKYIQDAVLIPVFDYFSMINMIYHSLYQKSY